MKEKEIQAPENIQPDSICDGGNLDCGSGLLLLIRKHIDKIKSGGILEIRSTEMSVREDLPSWCRMTQNPYLGWKAGEEHHKYFVEKKGEDPQHKEDYEKAKNYKWQCRISWQSGKEAKIFCRNHSWMGGQPASFDLKDQAPSAVEYFLGALGNCLIMGFQIHASQVGIYFDQLEMAIHGKLENIMVFLGVEEEGRSGFQEIQGTLYVQSDAEEEKLKELWKKTLRRSPLLSSLNPGISLDLQLKTL